MLEELLKKAKDKKVSREIIFQLAIQYEWTLLEQLYAGWLLYGEANEEEQRRVEDMYDDAVDDMNYFITRYHKSTNPEIKRLLDFSITVGECKEHYRMLEYEREHPGHIIFLGSDDMDDEEKKINAVLCKIDSQVHAGNMAYLIDKYIEGKTYDFSKYERNFRTVMDRIGTKEEYVKENLEKIKEYMRKY